MIGNAFKGTWSAGGVTLVELMVAMVVLTIATLGALGYQYHTARQAGQRQKSPPHAPYIRCWEQGKGPTAQINTPV